MAYGIVGTYLVLFYENEITCLWSIFFVYWRAFTMSSVWMILFWLFWACWGLGKTGWATFTGYYTIFTALFTSLYPAIAFFNFGKIGW